MRGKRAKQLRRKAQHKVKEWQSLPLKEKYQLQKHERKEWQPNSEGEYEWHTIHSASVLSIGERATYKLLKKHYKEMMRHY